MCTSAKTGEGITEALACLVRNVLLKELVDSRNNKKGDLEI